MFQPIGKVIQVKTAPAGLARSLEAAMITAKITELGQGRWQAIRYRQGRLTLVAPSAIAAQELTLRKQAIMDEITVLLGEGKLKSLTIRCA